MIWRFELMDNTKLRLEYNDLSEDCDLPDHLDDPLEEDYVQNRHLYTDKTFKLIEFTIALQPEITPKRILELVRDWYRLEERAG